MREDKNISDRTLVITLGVTLILICIGGNIVVYYLTGTFSTAAFIIPALLLPVFLLLMKKTKGQ